MRSAALAIFSIVLGITSACTPRSQAPSGPAKHYVLKGTIISVDPKAQTASIDAEAIPDYMEAMKMDYPIRDKQDLAQLKPGERISGTLDVFQSGDYTLHDIKPELKNSAH